MKILNTEKEDYHLHSFNFSDGLSTIDEIARFAGEIGMKKIAITDHSQFCLDKSVYGKKSARTIVTRWKNVFNDVEVIFGVEGDLINEDGDCCFDIQGKEGDFRILSYHREIYAGNHSKVADGFIKAIQRYHDKISVIGHLCAGLNHDDALRVIKEANKHKVPLELNAKYFLFDPEKWRVLLDNAEQIYINSDAHTLWELKTRRKDAREKLREMGYPA